MAIFKTSLLLLVGYLSSSAAQRSPYAGPRESSYPSVADRFLNPGETGSPSNMFDGNNLSIGNRIIEESPEKRTQTHAVGDDYAANYIATWNRESQPFAFLNAGLLTKQLQGNLPVQPDPAPAELHITPLSELQDNTSARPRISQPQSTLRNTLPQSQNSVPQTSFQNPSLQGQNWQNTAPRNWQKSAPQNWQNTAPRNWQNTVPRNWQNSPPQNWPNNGAQNWGNMPQNWQTWPNTGR